MISRSSESVPGLIHGHGHQYGGGDAASTAAAISEQAASGFADQGEKSLLFTF